VIRLGGDELRRLVGIDCEIEPIRFHIETMGMVSSPRPSPRILKVVFPPNFSQNPTPCLSVSA
jgi:hypothetical protein